jgi:hypothetical protein
MTLTLAAGAALVGQIIYRIGRYQIISVLGAVVLTCGVFLLARMDASTGLLEVTRNMIVVGLGLGMLQPVLTLAVQNAVPRTRLGVGTSAATYLRTTGQTLGVAVIGSVVNNTIASDLAARLPAQAKRLPPSFLATATNQQVLIIPGYKQQLTQAATTEAVRQAVAQATANVPPGPGHAQTVAAITTQVTTQVTAQVTHLLDQIFEATRLSLATGVQHGFWFGLVICAAAFGLTLFLKDVPLRKGFEMPSAAPETMSQQQRAYAMGGMTLAVVVDQAERPDANPRLLASLSSLADGRYPPSWSAEERGRAVARDVIEPMAARALLSSVENGHERTPASDLLNGAAHDGTGGQSEPVKGGDYRNKRSTTGDADNTARKHS